MQENRLIVRATTWQTFDAREPLQASLALLDGLWEPLMERTLPCGPFHPLGDQMLVLENDARRWLRESGYQLTLM